jgi:hypothetical protein
MRSPVRYNYVNGQGVGINNDGLGVNNNLNEQVVPEEDPSEDSHGGGGNDDLSNGY